MTTSRSPSREETARKVKALGQEWFIDGVPAIEQLLQQMLDEGWIEKDPSNPPGQRLAYCRFRAAPA